MSVRNTRYASPRSCVRWDGPRDARDGGGGGREVNMCLKHRHQPTHRHQRMRSNCHGFSRHNRHSVTMCRLVSINPYIDLMDLYYVLYRISVSPTDTLSPADFKLDGRLNRAIVPVHVEHEGRLPDRH